MAMLAAVGHQNLMAEYRVIDTKSDTPYVAPITSSTVVDIDAATSAQLQKQAERIRALESENADLRKRLGDAEWRLGERRAMSDEKNNTVSLPFDFGSISPKQTAVKESKILERSRSASAIEMIGYTDNTGDEAVNKRVALARAQNVKDMLVRNGISPAIITTREAVGVYLAPNDTEAGRTANRVVIVRFK